MVVGVGLKNWCFWTVEKTLEHPLDCKEIQPVHPKVNQSWIFIGRTDAEASILWSPDVRRQLIRKDPDARKDWRQEKGVTEDAMVGWHHRHDGHESEQTPGQFDLLTVCTCIYFQVVDKYCVNTCCTQHKVCTIVTRRDWAHDEINMVLFLF